MTILYEIVAISVLLAVSLKLMGLLYCKIIINRGANMVFKNLMTRINSFFYKAVDVFYYSSLVVGAYTTLDAVNVLTCKSSPVSKHQIAEPKSLVLPVSVGPVSKVLDDSNLNLPKTNSMK